MLIHLGGKYQSKEYIINMQSSRILIRKENGIVLEKWLQTWIPVHCSIKNFEQYIKEEKAA